MSPTTSVHLQLRAALQHQPLLQKAPCCARTCICALYCCSNRCLTRAEASSGTTRQRDGGSDSTHVSCSSSVWKHSKLGFLWRTRMGLQ